MTWKKRKDGKYATGRPRKMKKEVIDKLESAWAMGCSDMEACLYAGICKDVLYNYQKENPSFTERKEMLKETLVLKSRTIIAEQLKNNDREMAKWYLEKKCKKEFGKEESINNVINNNMSLGVDEDVIKKMNEMLRED